MQEHAEIRRFSLIPDVTLHIGLHSVSHFLRSQHYSNQTTMEHE